jgi:membrane protease YdiL (CAAX protease family)
MWRSPQVKQYAGDAGRIEMHTESSAVRVPLQRSHWSLAGALWVIFALAALVPATIVLEGSFPIFTVVWLVVPLIALAQRRDAARVGFRSVGWRELARTSAIAFAGLLLLAGLFEPWSHAYGLLVGEVLSNPRPDTTFAWLIRYDGLTAWAGLALYSGLVTIFAEELFFRGWLLQLLQRRMRPAWAIMLQATAFMLPNMIAALLLPPLSGLVYAGVYTWLGVGVIGGWAAWRTQSIWPSLVAATLWNLALTALVM